MYGWIHIAISAFFHLVETAREGSATAKQVVANRRHAIFLTEVGLEVCNSFLLTLFRYWRSITTRVSIFAPEIRNLESQVVIMCDGEHLNLALWERFVCGPSNVKIQKKLLNMGDLVFKKACSIAETLVQEYPGISPFDQWNHSSKQGDGTRM